MFRYKLVLALFLLGFYPQVFASSGQAPTDQDAPNSKALTNSSLLQSKPESQKPAENLSELQRKQSEPSKGPQLSLCSFNIQFLGYYKTRKDSALVRHLKASRCDMVVIQELVAPPDLTKLPASPFFGKTKVAQFPDGSKHRPSATATSFFLKMHDAGFDDFWLSEEDTGQSRKNKSNSTDTEWYVVFFKKSKFQINRDLPNGFLSSKLAQNPIWDRVPYATGFQTKDGKFDFVLINVHYHAGKKASAAKRLLEWQATLDWIVKQKRSHHERDFIVVGDMNFENGQELNDALADSEYESLNSNGSFSTNTNLKGPRPYDHILVNPKNTTEIELENNFEVLDLFPAMKKLWNVKSEKFPGEPYIHGLFSQYFSDHHPISTKIDIPGRDDD